MKTISLFSLLCLGQVASQTDLGGGITTRTDVKEYADLALDIRDIRTLAASGLESEVLGLYTEGLHSEIKPYVKHSLKKLNDDMATAVPRTPHYLFHLYGLSGLTSNVQLLNDQSHYADDFIRDIIGTKLDLAADAILALSMYMYAAHLLFAGIATCQERTLADNPDLVPLAGGGMDEFIALWIGTDQQPGSADGHSLYGWAEAVEAVYTPNGGEAVVNSQLKLLYIEGALALSLPHACTKDNTQTQQQLWNVATRITNEMARPLFQWLIFHLEEGNSEAVSLYAFALVPQLSKCRPSVYKRLKGNLIDRAVDFSKLDAIMEDLQEAFDCFGFSCQDFGFSNLEFNSKCGYTTSERVLAGFSPTSNVNALSRIDLDIHQLRVLVTLESYTIAKALYVYGSNVPNPLRNENDPFTLISLSQLAKSSARREADPVYSQFVSYFNNMEYANKAIMEALDGTGKWGTRTAKERAELIALTSSFQIVYMETIRKLNNAVDECNIADPSLGVDYSSGNRLDEAAVLLIGSMEGNGMGGSSDLDDGQLLWNLANERAFQFQTMNKMNYAQVNSEIIDLLYAAKGELDAVVCTNLERTVLKIQQLMTVGIIQSVIRSAIYADGLLPTSSDLSLVSGEVFALSVLPIIDDHDAMTAQLINENMVVKEDVEPIRDGKEVVADGMGFAITRSIKLSCSYLGSTSEVDPCRRFGDVPSSSQRRTTQGLVLTLGAVLALNLV